MANDALLSFIKEVLNNVPTDWLRLTTHRLDIYKEPLAKTEFLEHFENLYLSNTTTTESLAQLPTAFDYIRLGHPLSSVLEWTVGQLINKPAENVIAFGSKSMPLMAILRKNLLEGKTTNVLYTGNNPLPLDTKLLKEVYGYAVAFHEIDSVNSWVSDGETTVYIEEKEHVAAFDLTDSIDFFINTHPSLGSMLIANSALSKDYISEIQHVRRRESIAMTPANTFTVLEMLVAPSQTKSKVSGTLTHKNSVQNTIKTITGAQTEPLVASSGLSIQYAILMGLIHYSNEHYANKRIKIVVPPNCYGGTNDQARRVAACSENVDIVDLPVDGNNDMVKSIDQVLTAIAAEDAVPYIIAEIPTNPRVEVPNLDDLRAALSAPRQTNAGTTAVDPVFILDQTFCPNVQFLGEDKILSSVRTISFASGSKFPSGGLCTAGYCVANVKANPLMSFIDQHLNICDNEATGLQYEILANEMPSMLQRIHDAYSNTRDFVNFIDSTLPNAKINFVSESLAQQGFTPSVFSLDLPTKGATEAERERYKREQNLRLINLMIAEIPHESKFCVSYGQLKGCYWTIPATSTQGTTKEGDKDYIVRVSVSPNLDLEKHKEVFKTFVSGM